MVTATIIIFAGFFLINLTNNQAWILLEVAGWAIFIAVPLLINYGKKMKPPATPTT
jgi:hypothetical protein